MNSPPSPSAGANDRPRLTEAQKKENHIRSEQKRREAIREGYDRLAAIVPGMAGQGRSEALVMEATLKEMRKHIEKRQDLIMAAKKKGMDVTSWELDPQTVEACEAQKNRDQVDAGQQN